MYWLWRDRLRRKLRSSSYSRQNRSAAPCSLKPHIHRIRSLDPAMVLFESIVQIDIRPATDVAAQRRTDRPRIGVVPSVVTRSGTKPATERAERKNLCAALMSRVALSIVSIRFPSRSIARYR